MVTRLKQAVAGITLALLCAPTLASAYTPSPFQESSDVAIGTAINSFRMQPSEEVQAVTPAVQHGYIRKFAFPVTWVARLSTSRKMFGSPVTETLLAKRLNEMIYEKGDAMVRDNGKGPKLISPVLSYMDASAPHPADSFLAGTGAQALFLTPLRSPMSAEEWKGTTVALFVAPSLVQGQTSSSPAPTVEKLAQGLAMEKIPSARDLAVKSGTLLGQPSQGVSYVYERAGTTHRLEEMSTVLPDGTKVVLIILAPVTMFDRAAGAAALMEKQLVIGAPASGSSSSTTKESGSSSSSPSVKQKQPTTKQQRIEKLRDLLKKRLEKRKTRTK